MGGFFYKSLEIAPEKDLSFILRTYGEYVLDYDTELGMAMLREGYQAFEDERYWKLYCAAYPLMTSETFQKFSDFKKMQKSPAVHHTKDQILGKVEGILGKFNFRNETDLATM